MALYQTVAYTTTGTKTSVALDKSIVPFNASIGVTVGTTGTYTLQYSFDPLTTADASALWFDSINLPAGTTTSGVTAIVAPVSKVRLVIAAISGTVTLQATQGFSTN